METLVVLDLSCVPQKPCFLQFVDSDFIPKKQIYEFGVPSQAFSSVPLFLVFLVLLQCKNHHKDVRVNYFLCPVLFYVVR